MQFSSTGLIHPVAAANSINDVAPNIEIVSSFLLAPLCASLAVQNQSLNALFALSTYVTQSNDRKNSGRN